MFGKRTTFIAYGTRAAGFFYRRKKLFLIIVTVLLSLLGINALYRSAISDPPRTDLTVFLRAADAVEENEEIYDVQNQRHWNYVYLPLLATLLVPFADFPLPLNALLWYLLSAGALCSAFLMLKQFSPEPESGFNAAALAFFLCLPSIINTLVRGQMGVLVLFLAVYVFYLYARGKSIPAGFALAFAVVLKTSPMAPIIFYFAVKREWKLCLSFAAGLVLFVLVIPSLVMGPERNFKSLMEYREVVSEAVSEDGHKSRLWHQLMTPFAEDNQSIYAALSRVLWKSEDDYIADSTKGLRWGVRVLGLALLGALCLLAVKVPRQGPANAVFAEYSLFCTLMLFISPVSEHHHYTVMALPLYAGLAWIQAGGLRPFFRSSMEIGIVTAAFGFLFGLIFEELSFWGVPVWGNFIFWMILAAVSFSAGRRLKETAA